ncbi:hypothetical protein BBP40_002385 [Aspergillus hancockii]|nr:hypothetical protein BBP40_002385 [Aspergillus hancockii]
MKSPHPYERPLLGVAARSGHVAVAKLLLFASADFTDVDKHTYSPLFLAATHGHAPIVQLILDRGADPNIQDSVGRTPLYGASIRGHIDVVNILLAHQGIKANVRENNDAGLQQEGMHTALHSAVIRRQPEMLRLRVNRDDIDPNAVDGIRTALDSAVDYDEEGLGEILLTDARVNLGVTAGGGMRRTPSLCAAILSRSRIVRLLLDAGANRSIADQTGVSAALLLEAPSAAAREALIRRALFRGNGANRDLSLSSP